MGEPEGSVPDVTVVIPLYNRAHLIPFTLASLRPEHHPGVALEIVVVDDGSTDGGDEIATREFPTVRLLRTQRGGAPKARNTGLASANGAAVMFLDSDDLIEPHYFPPRLSALRANASADAVYGPFAFFDGEDGFSEKLVRPRHTPYPIDTHVARESHLWRLLAGWFIPPPAVVWRTSSVLRLGGYDESLCINQDVDLMFRALVAGGSLVGCTGPRGLYRDHSAAGRQGKVGGDVAKAQDLLRVRRRFVSVLERAGLLSAKACQALGSHCFYQWFEFRDSMPTIAEEFYALSRRLHPAMRLSGSWPLRVLSAGIGARRAMIVADAIRRACRRAVSAA